MQEIKTPPVSHFIKRAAGITMGSQRPGHSVVGKISLDHVYEIAVVRLPRLPICTTLFVTQRRAH